MDLLDRPLLICALSLLALTASSWLGRRAGRRRRALDPAEREDFGLVLGATLTLLGLVIGFSFSMAVGRYDQRIAYEEAEANAIGTEFLRADLLGAADAERVRSLLRSYLDLRIEFYTAGNDAQRASVKARTAESQTALWGAVSGAAAANPTPLTALVASGMNSVIDAQGYTQAAWNNRIPPAAWALMAAMALCATFLVGYDSKHTLRERGLLLVLPLVLSIAFFLIADIESPRGGSIRVAPQNLQDLAASIRVPAPPSR